MNEELLNYFKGAHFSEHDQERFLLCCLNYVSKQNKDFIFRELVHLFCGKDQNFQKEDIKRDPTRIILSQIGNKDGKIDIVIPFIANGQKYVIGLEHKTLSTRRNPLTEYEKILKEKYPNCKTRLCFLDPFEVQKQSMKKNNKNIYYVSHQYFDTLFFLKDSLKDSLKENNNNFYIYLLIDDYLSNYLLNPHSMTSSYSNGKIKIIAKYLNVQLHCDVKYLTTKSLEISNGEQSFRFYIDGAWEYSKYYLEFDSEIPILKSSKIIVKLPSRKNKFFISESGKQNKVEMVSDIEYVVSKCLKEMEELCSN